MSSINHRSSARRKRPAQPYHTTPTNSVEERLLQQAIENSKIDVKRSDFISCIPRGPTFFPTVEEFEGNPLKYINKIRHVAQRYGICKIVPPAGWNPPFCVDMKSKKKFQTKEQLLYRIQEGIAFGDGEDYNPTEYQAMASKEAQKWQKEKYDANEQSDSKSNERGKRELTPENIERDYWDLVENSSEQVIVEYGNDIDTTEYWSGFPLSERGRCLNGKTNKQKLNLPEPKFDTEDFYKESFWNLNNIPFCPESILRHVKVGINGINVPWLYFGSLFSTFCWHNEDNYLYSINYHHRGCPKLWYGVPGTRKDAEGLERVFKNSMSMKMREAPDLLQHITTMFSPRLLQQGGVPVCKVLQYPGEFIVTFPRAFHGGFSMGPNIGEAVNFATHDWIAHGADANERYRSFSRSAVFSHDRLTFTMANHHKEQQSYNNCLLLVKELKRVIDEELRLRSELISSGVRDVSGYISLPKNRLDQLDEESADYDDKRLCIACKHVCFFSAVACSCSQSKVSCLRHSHQMCRCNVKKKYLMIWSTEKDLKAAFSLVEKHCDNLRERNNENPPVVDETLSSMQVPEVNNSMPKIACDGLGMVDDAPGALRDKILHQDDRLDFSSIEMMEPFTPLRVADKIISNGVEGILSVDCMQQAKKLKNDTIKSVK